MNRMQQSLDKFTKDFYEFILLHHPDKDPDDWEFGAYDYFWLSILMAFWIDRWLKNMERLGSCNGFFKNCEDQSKKVNKLVQDLLRMSNADDPALTLKTLLTFRKYFQSFWT